VSSAQSTLGPDASAAQLEKERLQRLLDSLRLKKQLQVLSLFES
jgi:hypothetical protein